MEYVSVPVPSHLVVEVMGFIHSRLQGNAVPEPTSADEDAEAAVEASDAWPEDELRKLWNDSEGNMRIVLTLLARKGGAPIPSQEIAAVLGKPERGHAVAGTMGALGRRLKHRHGGRSPFSVGYNALARRWEYTMPVTNASVIAKIATPVPELVTLSGEQSGFFCLIRDPADRKCRITSVKPSEGEAHAAAERWLHEASERGFPPAGRGKTHEWVKDPAFPQMYVCVEIKSTATRATPIVY
ncbi:MAG: hypothetical protein JNK05_13420 [Myxococcales bacterium]|nr:hypothetical protein [Myxococcales bacterium]